MTRFTVAGVALIAAISGASGWFLADKLPSTRPSLGVEGAPAITPADQVHVYSDGTVSIQLSKAPLPWLWDELARQGGAPPRAHIDSTANLRTAESEAAPKPNPVQNEEGGPADVLRALRDGNATQRLAALQQANSVGAELPSELLQQFIDSDPSDQVRLEAFKAYLDMHSNDPDAVARVLDAGRYNRSAEVREESLRRLAMFDQQLTVQAADVKP